MDALRRVRAQAADQEGLGSRPQHDKAAVAGCKATLSGEARLTTKNLGPDAEEKDDDRS